MHQHSGSWISLASRFASRFTPDFSRSPHSPPPTTPRCDDPMRSAETVIRCEDRHHSLATCLAMARDSFVQLTSATQQHLPLFNPRWNPLGSNPKNVNNIFSLQLRANGLATRAEYTQHKRKKGEKEDREERETSHTIKQKEQAIRTRISQSANSSKKLHIASPGPSLGPSHLVVKTTHRKAWSLTRAVASFQRGL